jgi:hypothetical protein
MGDQKFQNFSLRAVCHRLLVERDGLGLIDQSDALGKLAPYDQHGVLGQRFWVILAHGNSPLAVAMSLLDQGSVVKVQFLAKKSDLLADCTKATLNCPLTRLTANITILT